MSAAAEQLLRELHENANVSGQKPLEQRQADLAIWFYRNMESISRDNLASRQAFLEKAFWIQLEVIALLTERLHKLEGHTSLYLPRGVRVNGHEFR